MNSQVKSWQGGFDEFSFAKGAKEIACAKGIYDNCGPSLFQTKFHGSTSKSPVQRNAHPKYDVWSMANDWARCHPFNAVIFYWYAFGPRAARVRIPVEENTSANWPTAGQHRAAMMVSVNKCRYEAGNPRARESLQTKGAVRRFACNDASDRSVFLNGRK